MSGIVKRDSVSYRGAAGSPRPVPKPVCGPAPRGPNARLIQVGGDVRALEVCCACGESIVVELDYPVDGAGDQAREASDR